MLTARIIPQRGSWVEILLDVDDVLTVNIDRRKKMPATILLRALGYSSNEQLLSLFYDTMRITIDEKNRDNALGSVNARTVFNEDTGEILVDSNEVITEERWKNLIDNGFRVLSCRNKIAG